MPLSEKNIKPLFLEFEVIGHAVAVDIRLPNSPDPIRATVDCGGPVQAMCLHQVMCNLRNVAVAEFAEAMYRRGRIDADSKSGWPKDFPCVL